MTKTTQPRTIHARATGLTVPAISAAGDALPGRVLYQGETITLSPEQVEATYDRTGASWLDLTPEEQVKRWGMQRFGDGPAPEGLKLAGDDESFQYRAGLAARSEAEQISNPAERRAALAEVSAEYGAVLSPRAQGPVRQPDRTGF